MKRIAKDRGVKKMSAHIGRLKGGHKVTGQEEKKKKNNSMSQEGEIIRVIEEAPPSRMTAVLNTLIVGIN